MIKAVETVFPSSVRIRCWFHRHANIRAKLPDDEAADALAHLYSVPDAPTLDAARAAADGFENTYGRAFPAAVVCFADDREVPLSVHRVLVRYHIRVRTTNLAQRSLEEEGRRTKVVTCFTSERSMMKLAFATMIRSAERWCRVSVNDIERQQLKMLRAEVVLDPPPAEDHSTGRSRTAEHRAA
jgi:transposase-like protein